MEGWWSQVARQVVVGIMGKKWSGKSTFASALRDAAGVTGTGADIEFSDPIILAANLALRRRDRSVRGFSDQLVAAASIVTGRKVALPPHGWYGRNETGTNLQKGLAAWLDGPARGDLRLTRENKDEHRIVLSWLGVNFRDLAGEGVWAEEIVRRIRDAGPAPLVTAGGVRFPRDAAAIRGAGGRIIEVTSRRVQSDTDPANAHHHMIEPDAVVYNNVALREVPLLAQEVWADLSAGRPKARYGPS